MTALVLASTSSHRRALLQRLGLPFTCEAPGVDEDAATPAGASPIERARTLARAKAQAVATRHADAVVVGSDQVCVLGAEVLGKPGDAARAAAQLQRLQGNEHQLLTAVAVQRGGEVEEFVDVTTLRMRQLDAAAIARYVASDQPFDCAGSYKIEALGIALFDTVQSEDHTAITGLPLLRLCRVLRRFGLQVP